MSTPTGMPSGRTGVLEPAIALLLLIGRSPRLAAQPAAPASAPRPEATLAIEHATVFPMDRDAGEFARRHLAERVPFGVVQVGSSADLVLLAADPRADIAVLRRPVGTVLRGTWRPAR